MAPESRVAADRRRACSHRWHSEEIEPVDALDLLCARIDRRPLFYFEHPVGGRALVAGGQAHAIRTSGATRFSEAAGAARELRRTLVGDSHGAGPPLVGGFGFAPDASPSPVWREFPACWLFLPAEALVLEDRGARRIVTEPCEAAADRARGPRVTDGSRVRDDLTAAIDRIDRSRSLDLTAGAPSAESHRESYEDRWRARVDRVLADIEQGRVSKLVLARSASGSLEAGADVVRVLRSLRDARPGCYTFLVAVGETLFLGSSPELLVRRSGDRVETQSLAGTIARMSDSCTDGELVSRLQASDKDAREHAEVIRGIVEALAPVTDGLEVAERPQVLAVPEAFHLHTPIRGRLRTAASVLDLAGLLHPTPAVCGMPRAEAARRLAAEEPDRGWYSGAVGWMDFDGDGEFAVALRSALLDRGRYVCWAGAGIVAGSRPDAELIETETKMRAVRRALMQDRP